MDLWRSKTLKALVLPGGAILLAADVVFREAFGPIPAPIIHFCFYAVSAAGIFLAWRFHSSRILFALLTLLLAHRALEFFSDGHMAVSGPGRIALEAIAFLLPLNFIAFSVFPERGLALPAIFSRLAVLFFESVFVAIICRPGEIASPGFLHPDFLTHLSWTRIPTLALLAFGASLVVLLLRFLSYGKPTESGLLWALVATFISFQTGAVGSVATAYLAAASLILVISIIENSYVLAYHDELTALPARRAFNDALFRLEEPYAVAAVDIDHFKRFNDTYGHETGDQVLRMVAAKLAGATGGGQAYRVGGEEFTILFPAKQPRMSFPIWNCSVPSSKSPPSWCAQGRTGVARSRVQLCQTENHPPKNLRDKTAAGSAIAAPTLASRPPCASELASERKSAVTISPSRSASGWRRPVPEPAQWRR